MPWSGKFLQQEVWADRAEASKDRVDQNQQNKTYGQTHGRRLNRQKENLLAKSEHKEIKRKYNFGVVS